jgi:penicillin-binding protein 1C
MRPEAVEITQDILADARARDDGFGGDLLELTGGRRFGLKTGTSSGFRDAWAAAFTDEVTVVVWLGDPRGRALRGVSGFAAAAPAAARILAAALARAEADGLAAQRRDDHGVRLLPASVCADTGLRAGAHCRHTVRELFVPGTVPQGVCDAHDAHGDVILGSEFQNWVERARPLGVATRVAAVPESDDPLHVREPRDGARWVFERRSGRIVIPLRATLGGREVPDAAWEVDGERLADGAWEPQPGEHVVVAEWRGRRSRPSHVRVEWAP